jgi:hypothetical protein
MRFVGLVGRAKFRTLVGGGPGVESHGPPHFGEQLKPFWACPAKFGDSFGGG